METNSSCEPAGLTNWIKSKGRTPDWVRDPASINKVGSESDWARHSRSTFASTCTCAHMHTQAHTPDPVYTWECILPMCTHAIKSINKCHSRSLTNIPLSFWWSGAHYEEHVGLLLPCEPWTLYRAGLHYLKSPTSDSSRLWDRTCAELFVCIELRLLRRGLY